MSASIKSLDICTFNRSCLCLILAIKEPEMYVDLDLNKHVRLFWKQTTYRLR